MSGKKLKLEMSPQEEFGSMTADIMIDDHGCDLEYLESDDCADQFRDEYHGMHPMSSELSCDVAYEAFLRRAEERLSSCAHCDQPPMTGSEFCADCRTIDEELWDVSKTKPPRRPAELLGEWIARPCGTIADRRIR